MYATYPGINGEIGEPNLAEIRKWERHGGTYPPSPVRNESGAITHWVRYVGGRALIGIDSPAYIKDLKAHPRQVEGHPVVKPRTFNVPSHLRRIAEQYHIPVAPSMEILVEHRDRLQVIQATKHIAGQALRPYLMSSQPSEATKARLDELVINLSTYARDAATEMLDTRDGLLCFDIADFKQYLLEDLTERPVLIDTEALSVGSEHLAWGFINFYDALACNILTTPNLADSMIATGAVIRADYESIAPHLPSPTAEYKEIIHHWALRANDMVGQL